MLVINGVSCRYLTYSLIHFEELSSICLMVHLLRFTIFAPFDTIRRDSLYIKYSDNPYFKMFVECPLHAFLHFGLLNGFWPLTVSSWHKFSLLYVTGFIKNGVSFIDCFILTKAWLVFYWLLQTMCSTLPLVRCSRYLKTWLIFLTTADYE